MFQIEAEAGRLPSWAVSWAQVSPLAIILVALFALPTVLFLIVSFFDYDRVGIYPAFIFDNYHDLLTTPSTLRVYIQLAEIRLHRLGHHALPRVSTSPTS